MQFRRARISSSTNDAGTADFLHGKTIYTQIPPSIPVRLKWFQKPTFKTLGENIEEYLYIFRIGIQKVQNIKEKRNLTTFKVRTLSEDTIKRGEISHKLGDIIYNIYH